MPTAPTIAPLIPAEEQVIVHTQTSYTTYKGTSGNDVINGSYRRDHLFGGAGNDTLNGQGGNDDILVGGAGVDALTGSAVNRGTVTFVFTSLTDSYANAEGSHSDLITGFRPYDRLDLTALGLERIGNGHNGDLAVSYDATTDITYLRSLDKDASGNFFEVRLAGDFQGQLSTYNFALRHDGTVGNDTLDYSFSTKQYVLNGLDGDDTLTGGKFTNVLDGGAGSDHLMGNSGYDTFLYHQLSDSFVNDASGVSSVDLISNFNLFRGDVLDVSALGFTGLGDGYNGTLNYTYDKTAGHFVAQSFEADAQGNRFKVYIDQDYRHGSASYQDADGFIFAGDDYSNAADQTLTGKPTWDALFTGSDGGILIGGGAGDALTGINTGVDTFRYLDSSDSVHGAADLITDFDVTQDKIDVAALGYTGLGDGTNGTLKLVYDTDLHRTYLKDYDLNAEGQRFEIALEGSYTKTFTANNLVVASTVLTAEHVPDATIELVGVAPSDTHLAG
jgi:Ca2+-binding RTX toxin-like protein